MKAEKKLLAVRDVSSEPKRLRFNVRNKKLKLLCMVLAALVLVGGVAAALVVRSIDNKPENVLAKAISKYAFSSEPKSFDLTTNVEFEEPLFGASEVDLKMDVATAGKSAQLDMELNISVLRLRGAVQFNEDGNIYVKVKDLPTLLGSDFANNNALTEEMRQKVLELDNKWIEITRDDIAKLTGGSNSEDVYGKCSNKLYELMSDKKLGDKMNGFYKGNRFLLARSSSEEVIDGKKLLKVEVDLDKDKLESFGLGLRNTAEYKDLMTVCGGDEEEADSAYETLPDNEEFRNSKTYVWLDRGKKELVKVEMGTEFYQEGEKVWVGKVTMGVKSATGVKIEAPTDKVNITDLLQSFGISPEMLNSSYST